MDERPRGGYRYSQWKRLVLATYGDVCHLCGHGGARQVDHLESVTERPELMYVVANGRPAHGSPGNKCPVCGLHCNQVRGAYSVERARRIIAERAGLKEPPRKPKPEETGREWLLLGVLALRAPARAPVRLVLGSRLQLEAPPLPGALLADLVLNPGSVGVPLEGYGPVPVGVAQGVQFAPPGVGDGRTAPRSARWPPTRGGRRTAR
jgi:hypothetical protein